MAVNAATDLQFREYLAVADDTAKLSDRRQTVSDLFVGINSLFLAATGYVAISSQLKTWWATVICGAITGITLLFNGTWIRLIHRYRALINLRVRYLEALERDLQASGTFTSIELASEDGKRKEPYLRGVYSLEGSTLYRKGPKIGFFRLERQFIILFMLSYFALTAAIAVLTWLITQNMMPPLSL